MANGSGGGNAAVWVALIGLVTTVSGGVFANWDRLFPHSEPEQILQAQPPEAGVAVTEAAAPEDAASGPDGGESEEAAAAASSP